MPVVCFSDFVGTPESGNTNNLSYVLRLDYAGVRVILPGDAEEAVWESILSHYPARELKCSVLKAAHHGRDSGYHERAVAAMNPEYTIVSVGKKPETDASSKYRQHSKNVWSTRWFGNIVLTVPPDGRGSTEPEHRR